MTALNKLAQGLRLVADAVDELQTENPEAGAVLGPILAGVLPPVPPAPPAAPPLAKSTPGAKPRRGVRPPYRPALPPTEEDRTSAQRLLRKAGVR